MGRSNDDMETAFFHCMDAASKAYYLTLGFSSVTFLGAVYSSLERDGVVGIGGSISVNVLSFLSISGAPPLITVISAALTFVFATRTCFLSDHALEVASELDISERRAGFRRPSFLHPGNVPVGWCSILLPWATLTGSLELIELPDRGIFLVVAAVPCLYLMWTVWRFASRASLDDMFYKAGLNR